jgi:hypothetical protein
VSVSFQLRADLEHECGKKRGLAQEIFSQFGCGLCLSKGMFAGRYAIPLHNASGELVGYAGRWLDDQDPLDFVVVVEGFFSVMKLHQ